MDGESRPNTTRQLGEEPIHAALASDGAEEREEAYRSIEGAVKERNLPLVVACVKPMIESVLCAPAAKVRVEECRRANQLLYSMCKVDVLAVCAESLRKNEAGYPVAYRVWTASDTVLAAVLAKNPDEWDHEDAITVALHNSWFAAQFSVGYTALSEASGVGEMNFLAAFTKMCPFMGENPQPPDRYATLAVLCLDLLRKISEHHESIVTGAAGLLGWIPAGIPAVGKAVWEAGFVEVMQTALQRWNPMERISKDNLMATAIFVAANHTAQEAERSGIDIIQPYLDAGVVDIAISTLTAYQMLGRPEEASVNALIWGGVFLLDYMLASPQASEPVATRLRSAGVDAVRYVLDHPLSNFTTWNETGGHATKIAAKVWGRSDDADGLVFRQTDIDKIVEAAGHHGDAAQILPMSAGHGQSILNLSVSEINKDLLLNAEGFIPLLVDSLLLDPDHPRRNNDTLLGSTDFEAVKGPVQRDFAEAIAQFALYPRGHEALLQDSTVTQALQQVAAEGWEQEARAHAEAALAALVDYQPNPDAQYHEQKHVMLSYQWNVQELVRRIVNELQARDFRTWFDLDNMKGSIVDSMSDAVDNADAMLSCISLAYKESANCRLECQYGHERGVLLIPLMVEKGYRPTGWLGLLIGTRLYFNFHPEAVATDELFMQQIDLVERELGSRGKTRRISEGVPPPGLAVQSNSTTAPAPVSAPAPVPVEAPAPAPAPASLGQQEQSHSRMIMRSKEQPSSAVSHLQPTTMELTSFITEQLKDQLLQIGKLQEEVIEAKIQAATAEMKVEIEALRLRDGYRAQVSILQSRLEELHATKLLSDQELFRIEDIIADASGLPNDETVCALISLGNQMSSDKSFARQLKRKFM